MTFPPPSSPPDPSRPGQPPYSAGPKAPYGAPVGNLPYPSAPQAGYGGPRYNPPGMPPPTDNMAIAALVCGLITGPVGVILGLVALGRIRRSGAKGRGLAITGIVLGSLSIVSAVALVAFAATGAFDSSPENISDERSITADELEAGHCANFVDVDNAGERVPVVPCSDAHDLEIIGDVGTEADFLGGDTMNSFGEACAALVSAHVVADAEQVEVQLLPIIPADSADRLATRYLCVAVTPDATITGSFVVGDAEIS